MIIFGIDPGTVNTGFGVISFKNNKLAYISSGIVSPSVKETMPRRLKIIFEMLNKEIQIHNPDELALETAFYGKNVQSAMKIGYARGISMLVSAMNEIEIFEYSPRTVKQSVVGRGAATKEQVQFMVFKLLGFPNDTKMRFDETDALAVAICHAFRKNFAGKGSGSWKKFIEENPEIVKQ